MEGAPLGRPREPLHADALTVFAEIRHIAACDTAGHQTDIKLQHLFVRPARHRVGPEWQSAKAEADILAGGELKRTLRPHIDPSDIRRQHLHIGYLTSHPL